ncbi:MAG: replicative DNA helicase [Acidimicrobiia bacterium]|nr:replicative DNA helicase [Acidimicrobiia bacterium]
MSDGETLEPPLEAYAPPAREAPTPGERMPNGGRSPGVRVPPHNAEAEESVIGALLISSDAANQVIDRLRPEDFYIPAYQAIYEVIVDLYNANQPIDAVTVTDGLRRKEELDRVGGVGFVTQLMHAVPVASRVDYYAEIVEEHALRRNLITAAGRISDLAMLTDQEIDLVIDSAEQTVLGVAERRVGEGLLELSSLLQTSLESIEEMEANAGEITGLATGFRDLDRKLAGLQPANLVVIAARPAMGKSAMALNVATNVATNGGTVAIFSMEMGKEEIIQRLLCSLGRVDSMKLRAGQLGPQLWQKVVNAASRLYQAPIYVDDSAQITVTDVRAKCRRLKRHRGLDLVVLDYLQLMQGRNRENRQQEIAEISRNLKNLARELGVPIIAVSQLNRSLEAREDKRPRLGDLRESGAIEQDADIVMFIYRDEYYHPENQESKGLAEVIVAKHRAGSTGRIDMTFMPEFTLFGDHGMAEVP